MMPEKKLDLQENWYKNANLWEITYNYDFFTDVSSTHQIQCREEVEAFLHHYIAIL